MPKGVFTFIEKIDELPFPHPTGGDPLGGMAYSIRAWSMPTFYFFRN